MVSSSLDMFQNFLPSPLRQFIRYFVRRFWSYPRLSLRIQGELCEFNYQGISIKLYPDSWIYCPVLPLRKIPDLSFFIREMPGYFKFYQPKEGDTIIDAGAFIGAFAIYVSKKIGNNGKVIAFEPDIKNYELLMKNITINNLDNVFCYNYCLWNTESELKFYASGRNTSSVVAVQQKEEKDTQIIRVKAVALDNFLTKLNISNVDFIKMDIEGAEIEALNGAIKLLKRNNPNLAIASYHKRDGVETHNTITPILSQLGYNVSTIFSGQTITYASKRNLLW